MKTITKELHLLDIEDVESALSLILEETVSISDVDCYLVYCIGNLGFPEGMFLNFSVYDNEELLSFDVFSAKNRIHYWDGKWLSLNEAWLPVNEIFNFDPAAFKSFDIFFSVSEDDSACD